MECYSPYEATGPDFSAGGVDKLRLQGMVSECRNVMPLGRHKSLTWVKIIWAWPYTTTWGT